ncbi:MAG TPA: amino acid ABC transporter substrate-binding protein [Reyranella sp.]|nr:amino acid ABC transporter substrate-binding protein [Reyranella sp.]
MRIVGIIVAACTLALAGPPAHAQHTLQTVKKRGQLACGINGQLPGFSLKDDKGEWKGFEIDFCRAVAAAVLGDATKVHFVPLSTVNRFDALRKGEIDVLARNSTATLTRTAKTGVRDATVIYVDGQAVVVPKNLNVTRLSGLDKASVCILKGTPYQERLEEWFTDRKLSITPVLFDNQTAMYEAFFASKCNAITQDISALAATIIASGKSGDYFMLSEIIATDPLSAFVRAGDEEWFDVVRWTHFAQLEAEELGVTQANAEAMRQQGNPSMKRLLGAIPGNGKLLGLDEDWAFHVIREVGNYADTYERNLGGKSQLHFARGVNALWRQGGTMYPLPPR